MNPETLISGRIAADGGTGDISSNATIPEAAEIRAHHEEVIYSAQDQFDINGLGANYHTPSKEEMEKALEKIKKDEERHPNPGDVVAAIAFGTAYGIYGAYKAGKWVWGKTVGGGTSSDDTK